MMNRRSFLTSASAVLTSGLVPVHVSSSEEVHAPLGIPLKQEALPYDFEALEPFLDAATLRLHYEDHHAQHLQRLLGTLKQMRLHHVGNVVALIGKMHDIVLPVDPHQKAVPMGGPPLRPSPEHKTQLRVYGGGHVNHTIFWRFLAPAGAGPQGPEGRAAAAIDDEFGSLEEFKAAFTAAALKHFGSGWAWLVYRPDGRLVITTTRYEDSPLMPEVVKPEQVGRPLLCLDLWEHAYYLKYQNDRKAYVEAWWNVVNWAFVTRAYNVVTSIGRV